MKLRKIVKKIGLGGGMIYISKDEQKALNIKIGDIVEIEIKGENKSGN